MPRPETWADAPTETLRLPACPDCNSLDHRIVRTADNGDGTWTRKVVCRSCGCRFKIFVLPDRFPATSLPVPGNIEVDTSYDCDVAGRLEHRNDRRHSD